MALDVSGSSPQDMTESESLLSNQDEQMYYEMSMSENVRVDTVESKSCLSLSGSTQLIIAAIVASLGGVLFGYDLGIVSGAMLQLKHDFKLDCQQQEMVVSSMLFGALLGSLFGGYIVDYLGRRRTIIVNAFVFFAGALMLAFSTTYTMLIIGRLIVGFGTSLSAVAECIYIAEIAPPRKRGFLVSLNEIGIASGILLAYFVNYIFINTDNGWRYMFGLSGIPALIQGYGVIFLPPSPRWLICQGHDTKALKVMRSLNLETSPEEEISKMKDALDKEHRFNICYLFGQHQNMRDRMFVGLGVVFFQQFTGQPSVLYYAPSIFENIGFHSHSAATLATVGIGVTKLLATVFTLSLVDKAGRRRFLLIGSILMTASISVLFTVTLCFPGEYHKELCTNSKMLASNTTTRTNLSLSPSFSSPMLSTTTCTPSLVYIPQTHTPQVHSLLVLTNQTRSSINYSSMTSTTTDFYKPEVKLICFSQPGPTIMATDISSTHSNSNNSSEDEGDSEEMPDVVRYVTLFSLMIFAGAYSCGYGPISWLVLSEIFPTEIKGRAFASATALNWASNLIVSLTMLDLIDSVGVSWTFFIYGIIGAMAVIFIYKFVPETKNRSLEEINALFSNRNPLLGNCLCFSPAQTCCRKRYAFVSSNNTPQDSGLLEGDEWQI